MDSSVPLTRESVPAFLKQFEGERYVEGWAELWRRGDCLPWDRGFPNPALEDTLKQQRGLLGRPVSEDAQGKVSRKKALVPGCGRGVDVLLLASFGYDAYGLEYSPGAVEACKQEEARHGDKYPVEDEKIGRGKIVFVQGDFFKDDWLNSLGIARNGFDLIYDYTFFCALNPALRPQWAARHRQLLAPSPGGNLICLEFPRHKDPAASGPPFASQSEAYLEHLSHPGEEIPYDSKGYVKSDALRPVSEDGFERVAYWQPERTHEIGRDQDGKSFDRVSVWRRRN